MLAKRALFLLLMVGFVATPAHAQTKPKRSVEKTSQTEVNISSFLRLTRDQKTNDPEAVETAVVRYTHKDGTIVYLLAAIHYGDRSYYRALNRRMSQKKCDRVLYELVASKNTKPKRGQSQSPIATLLTTILEIKSQMNEINYSSYRFVHADMTPTEIRAALDAKGYDIISFMLRVFSDMMRQQNLEQKNSKPKAALPELDIEKLLTDHNRAYKIKRVLAQQMITQASADSLGELLKWLLIEKRNEKVMKVLRSEKDKGNGTTFGIFYGAAHMPDFHKRLITAGYKRTGTEWLVAMDLEETYYGLADDIGKAVKIISAFQKAFQQ